MKCTLFITMQCNLACQYCYVGKQPATMSCSTAKKVIDFVLRHAPLDEPIDIGFFGGEPLLEFDLVKAITRLIEDHPSFDPRRVRMTIVTNGTIFSDDIADFVSAHEIGFGISCDGAPRTHDLFRRFPDGEGSSDAVARNIRRAVDALCHVMTNAVYHPRSFQDLPDTVRFLSSLGVRQIYLNPDFSAPWRESDARLLPEVYDQVGQQYIAYYLACRPHFISLIDSKITVILRGGYAPNERCQMGRRELAFAPDGAIYACERLIGAANDGHCIGHVDQGLKLDRLSCHLAAGSPLNPECLACGLRDYCMNWCGCSNYFASGYYNRVSAFLCASERAAIQTAFHVYQTLEGALGAAFVEHVSGYPALNSIHAQGGRAVNSKRSPP
jgi:uncharacterized protein